jgi:putative ABC transport system substrate-binding protein
MRLEIGRGVRIGASGPDAGYTLRDPLTMEARMVRRFCLLALIVGCLAAPVAPQAQPGTRMWRIGLFHVGLDHVPPSLAPLRAELRLLGYEEGRNLALDWRNLPDEKAARVTAREFAHRPVDLIVAFENQTVRAAMAATSTIPVVFLHVTDPVADGFVTSLSHPGGNLTGPSGWRSLIPKQIQLFTEMVPSLRRLLVLIDPGDPASSRVLAEARSAGSTLKVDLVEREVGDAKTIEALFRGLHRGDVDGVFPLSPTVQTNFTSLLVRLATERGVPLYGNRKEWVQQGALFSYAPDNAEVGRVGARYVDRILRGTKPADLPVEQMDKLELALNLKTAKALGLTMPQSILARADKVFP